MTPHAELEAQIDRWRGYVQRNRAISPSDVDELEDHLREQIADRQATGLDDEEAFLVVEAGRLPVGDLLAQVILQLVDVGGGDRPVPLNVAAPPVDLGLQLGAGRHHAHPSGAAEGP